MDNLREFITDTFVMGNKRSAASLRVSIFPSGADIPDEPDAINLGVLNWEWMTSDNDGLVDVIARFFSNSPKDNGNAPREFRNNVCVLVADADGRNGMLEASKDYLGVKVVSEDSSLQLREYQQERLKTDLERTQNILRQSIQKTYVNLYHPSVEHRIRPDLSVRLSHIQSANATENLGNGQQAIIEQLDIDSKLLKPGNADLNPETVWASRRNLQNGKVQLRSLREQFSRGPGEYKLLNTETAVELFRNGLQRNAIRVETSAGEVLTGNDLQAAHLVDDEAYVYLHRFACERCQGYEPDCICDDEGEQQFEAGPGLPLLKQPEHPDGVQELDQVPPSQDQKVFRSDDLEVEPFSVLKSQLNSYMQDNNLTHGDIEAVDLTGEGPRFTRQVGSFNSGISALVSYQLTGAINMQVEKMPLSEWSKVSRATDLLLTVDGGEDMGMTVRVSSEDPQAMVQFLDSLSASERGGMEVRFERSREE